MSSSLSSFSFRPSAFLHPADQRRNWPLEQLYHRPCIKCETQHGQECRLPCCMISLFLSGQSELTSGSCFCWGCRDPAWFSESWLSRLKTDVEENWRLKVLSFASHLQWVCFSYGVCVWLCVCMYIHKTCVYICFKRIYFIDFLVMLADEQPQENPSASAWLL